MAYSTTWRQSVTIELRMQLTGFQDVTHELDDSHIQLLEKQSLQGGTTLKHTRLHTHTLENRIQTFHRLQLIQVV